MMPRIIKRTLDFSAALLGLIVCAPLLGILALAIRLTMGAPVLFRQVRPGYKGRPFTMVKFRTMREAYNPDGSSLLDTQRLTLLGKFLRKTSIDELPQLWNVLTGEMSLVGPRPLLMEYLPRYTSQHARRHEMRPGITGWTQCTFKAKERTWEEKLEGDVWYITNWSLCLDLTILLATFGALLRRARLADDGITTADKLRGTEEEKQR